jgi:hypothetical protein
MRGSTLIIATTVWFWLALSALAQPSGLPGGQRMSSIGYPSVADALSALKARSDVKLSVQDGWTVIQDGMTLWSFTPADHAAHPSAVKRTLVEQDGGLYVAMNVLCQSTKSACDRLVADFEQLNEQMRASIARQRQRRAPAN